jgi:hypothetical protein
MAVPLVLKGVIKGKTIELEELSCLPDGCRVTVQLILDFEEADRIGFGSWADMTPEEVAEYEELMSEFMGRPVKLPEPDPS